MQSELLTADSYSRSPSTLVAEVDAPADLAVRLSESLRRWYGVEFAVVDAETGDLLSCPAEMANADWSVWGQVCRTVAERRMAEVIAEEAPIYVLAVPETDVECCRRVAVAVFSVRPLQTDDLETVARVMAVSPEQATTWSSQRVPLAAEMALRLAERFLEVHSSEERIRDLEREVEDLSVNLSSTYEEISLLYRLTQNLKLSSKDEELGRLALDWLADVVPAESLAIQFSAVAEPGAVESEARTESVLLMRGPCPLNNRQFATLIERLQPSDLHHPLILHGDALAQVGDIAVGIRELLIVPLCEGHNVFGYLAAFNHFEGREFGSVEASLLSSVAAILGIHSGNIELYRQQREFLRGVVRALTSAIDAKDPYTCGHSDRVARVAVRLAEELGCDAETLNTIYLSGLLHDIGKIGIDDNVLRKPGKLTEVEYEHIKLHSEIGYRILKDLRQLDEVLPVVLHHHEQWDGRGYPHKLVGESIPLMARIVAVADAFDAMGSDRPYRQGMPEARLDQVLREGAGKQWDPQIIDAFFRARDEIRDIFRRDREPQREIAQWI